VGVTVVCEDGAGARAGLMRELEGWEGSVVGTGGHVHHEGGGHHAVGGVCDCPSLCSWARKQWSQVSVAYGSASSGDPGQVCVVQYRPVVPGSSVL
jgi:hypothetical protein